MRFLALTTGVWVVAAASLRAQDARPFIRAEFTPPPPTSVIVGEPVSVTVSVFAPTFFSTAPEWPDTIDIAHAIGRLDEARAVNSTERVGDQSFAGISRTYSVYPLATGRITVPPISVIVSYSVEGRPSPATALKSSPLTFSAALPPGAAPSDHFVAASSFELSDRFDRPMKGLKVGDAVTRTITMTADGAWSAMLPPLTIESIDGVSVHAEQPTTDDKVNERGGPRRATRVERVSYVFERAGTVDLPPITVRWWDQSQHRLRTATSPSATVTIAGAAASSSAIAFTDEEAVARERAAAARAERRRREQILIAGTVAAVAAVFVVWFVRRFGRKAAERLTTAWRRVQRSEPMYFRKVTRASRTGDARATYAATLAWLDRAWASDGELMTLERAATLSGDPELRRQSDALLDTLYARPAATHGVWSGPEFSRLIARARPRLLRARRFVDGSPDTPLPPLNPTDAMDRRGSESPAVR
ncbi:MAG TPA: hypothetical protein VH583_24770 [Vicinamibacterales bacterium]|jgi:hypothetical protein